MSNSLSVLKQMRTLLSGGWCQKGMAQDAHDEPVQAHDEKATSFCLIGASIKAKGILATSWAE